MPLTAAGLLGVPARITTDRLTLVESDPAFSGEFAAAMRASHDELEFVPGWREAGDEGVAARSLQISRDRAEHELVRHAFLRDTGAYVARLDLHSWDVETPRCELGYLGDTRISGRGLVREAALAMVEVAWSLGVERVQAMVDARNERGLRFAAALGMEREGVLRRYERDDEGVLCDQVMFAVLRP